MNQILPRSLTAVACAVGTLLSGVTLAQTSSTSPGYLHRLERLTGSAIPAPLQGQISQIDSVTPLVETNGDLTFVEVRTQVPPQGQPQPPALTYIRTLSPVPDPNSSIPRYVETAIGAFSNGTQLLSVSGDRAVYRNGGLHYVAVRQGSTWSSLGGGVPLDLESLTVANSQVPIGSQGSFGSSATILRVNGGTFVAVGEPDLLWYYGTPPTPVGSWALNNVTRDISPFGPGTNIDTFADGGIWVFDVTATGTASLARVFRGPAINANYVAGTQVTSYRAMGQRFGAALETINRNGADRLMVGVPEYARPNDTSLGTSSGTNGRVLAFTPSFNGTFVEGVASVLAPTGSETLYGQTLGSSNSWISIGSTELAPELATFDGTVFRTAPRADAFAGGHVAGPLVAGPSMDTEIPSQVGIDATGAPLAGDYVASAWTQAAGSTNYTQSVVVDAAGRFGLYQRGSGGSVAYELADITARPSEDYLGGAHSTEAAWGCPGAANSTGNPGLLTCTGLPALSFGSLTLQASQLPTNATAYFMTSTTPAYVPNAGGSPGNLCLGGAIGRFLGASVQNTGSTGTAALTIDLTSLPSPTGTISAILGEVRYFQLWHRDSVGGVATNNFTEAIGFEIQ